MEYIISMMEGAVIEAITQHMDEITKSFQVNISYEDLEKSMHSKEIMLLKQILHIIEGNKSDDHTKLIKIEEMIWNIGIYNHD